MSHPSFIKWLLKKILYSPKIIYGKLIENSDIIKSALTVVFGFIGPMISGVLGILLLLQKEEEISKFWSYPLLSISGIAGLVWLLLYSYDKYQEEVSLMRIREELEGRRWRQEIDGD